GLNHSVRILAQADKDRFPSHTQRQRELAAIEGYGPPTHFRVVGGDDGTDDPLERTLEIVRAPRTEAGQRG
ncbi:MAG: hypothetical protein ACREX6_02605, partial [Casimicrobiaceae bacterium]